MKNFVLHFLVQAIVTIIIIILHFTYVYNIYTIIETPHYVFINYNKDRHNLLLVDTIIYLHTTIYC